MPDRPLGAGSADRPLRLLVVDDHEVVRQGLVAVLDRRPNFQVVAEAGTVEESLEQARRYKPDIVVMDVRLPDGSGVEACRDIRAELPGTRIVMLTSFPDDEAVLSAIVAGASGYLLKQIRARDLSRHSKPSAGADRSTPPSRSGSWNGSARSRMARSTMSSRA